MKIFEAGLLLSLVSVVCAKPSILGAYPGVNKLSSALQNGNRIIESRYLHARNLVAENRHDTLHQKRTLPLPRRTLQSRSTLLYKRSPTPRNRRRILNPPFVPPFAPPQNPLPPVAPPAPVNQLSNAAIRRRIIGVTVAGVAAMGAMAARVATTTNWQNPTEAALHGIALGCMGAAALTIACTGLSISQLEH